MAKNISPQLSAQLDNSSRVAHILWFALMASVAIYGLVVFLITRQGDEGATALPLPPLVFAALAVSSATTGVLLYRQFTSPDRIRAALVGPAPQTTMSQADLQALSTEEQRLSRVPQLVLTASIIRWALFESVAIFGLVQAISNRSFEVFLPYGIAAIALQAMTPPRLKRMTLEAIPLLSSDPR